MIGLKLDWNTLTSLKLSDCIPTPDFCFSLAPYPFTAGLIGAGYGGMGKILNPQKGVAPLPYAICFEAAYQIKQCFYLLGRFFHFYFNKLIKGDSQENIAHQGGLLSRLRFAYRKGIQLQAEYFQKCDQRFSSYFRIRSYEQVHASSLPQASWVEICRHRLWDTLKMTVINAASLSLSYQLCDYVGLVLPYRHLPFIVLLIQSIAFEIFIMPALIYLFHRVKRYVIEKAHQETGAIAAISRCYDRVLHHLSFSFSPL